MKKIIIVILVSFLVGGVVYYIKSTYPSEHEHKSCSCTSCSPDGCEGAENCSIKTCHPKK